MKSKKTSLKSRDNSVNHESSVKAESIHRESQCKDKAKKKHKRHKTKEKTPDRPSHTPFPSIDHDQLIFCTTYENEIDWRYCKTPSDCQGYSPE